MTGKSKAKGDRAEREAAELLTALTGMNCRRMLGAGRSDDVGDIDGIHSHAIQVANWKDTAAAAIQKPLGAEQQRINAAAAYAMTMVRFRGGQWRVVLTMEQWKRYFDLIHGQEETTTESD